MKRLKEQERTSESLYDKLKPIGSQPPCLYGLAKVHKPNTPLRPVLLMPGSAYYKIAKQVADWLAVVEECKINSSTKSVSENLNNICLEADEVLLSFDVSSLYTNVPVKVAIKDCANLLYSHRYKKPPVRKETFKEIATICNAYVLMLTSEGYDRQEDGLAMGSPPAPYIANAWLSKYDSRVKEEAKLYSR